MRNLLLCAVLVLFTWAVGASAQDQSEPIDFDKARQLIEKTRRGEQLSPDEAAYLQRAREARQAGQRPGARPGTRPGQAPATLPTGLVSLTQMTARNVYRGEDGGLYGGGQNRPPEAHQRAIDRALAAIAPLDGEGKPDKSGKVVLMSVGMSNTTQEFSMFKTLADRDKDKSPAVLVVDGALGGADTTAWIDPQQNQRVWDHVARQLEGAGVTARQVQAIWIKQAMKQPGRLGAFPKHAEQMRDEVVKVLQLAHEKFPNLKIAYLSSRIYAGYAASVLNPEPYAYEGAFAMRWVIQAQMKGDAALNYDPEKGDVKAPVVLWGPYLWADGPRGRAGDDLVWHREDFRDDGTHPNDSGRKKVADLLLKFFKTDANAKGWFTASQPPQ